MTLIVTPSILRRVADLWSFDHRNSWDIAKLFGVSEPQALVMIRLAREKGYIPANVSNFPAQTPKPEEHVR